MKDDKLAELLRLVIENYIYKGDPIWSKFLHSLEQSVYAPSTLRKYLNILEKEGLLYQPYNSAGRIPTVKGLSSYLSEILNEENVLATTQEDDIEYDLHYARDDLKSMVETLGEYADGVVVGFLKEDEYYYLGINNLLKESLITDHDSVRYIVKFIETKKIVQELDAKVMKKDTIYYTFIENGDKLISAVYSKVDISWYDAIISILGPARIDHKKNIMILKQFMDSFRQEL